MSDSDAMFLNPAPRQMLYRRSTFATARSRREQAVSAIVLVILAVISILTHYYTPLPWNIAATRALQALKAPGLHELMRLISGFGNAPKVIAITFVALLACNKRKEALFLAISGLGGWFLAMQLKHVFAAPRPSADLVEVFHHWPTGSFPSGHLVFYVCYFGFLFFIARDKTLVGSLFRRVLLLLLTLIICLVGFSRVYLGEHWLSDLPGSYFLGAVWLMLCLKLYRKWARERERRNDWFLPYRTTAR